jgi:hypothetical protein
LKKIYGKRLAYWRIIGIAWAKTHGSKEEEGTFCSHRTLKMDKFYSF